MMNQTVNLLPALLRRETGYTAFRDSHSSLSAFYGALYPNACVKLRTAEANNIQFSPCGTYILGLNSSGHSISVWDIDSFLSALSPPERSGPEQNVHPPSNSAGDAGTDALHQRLETANESDRSRVSPRQTGAVSARETCSTAEVPLPRKPALTFSNNLLANFNPVWQGKKGTLLGKHGRDQGIRTLAPVEVGDGSIMEEARSVLCTPAQPLDDAQLQQAWDRRGREQQAMIASWNQSRKRLRQSRSAALAIPSAPPPPSQPTVITAPCLRPALRIGGRPSENAPAEIILLPGSAALVATVTAGHEKLNDSICLFTRNRGHVLLLAESQPQTATDEGASASSSIIMVSLRTGAVVDRIQFMNERLVLQRNRSCVSWSLHDSTLVVLCPNSQQVHVYHVSAESLVHNRTLGAHLRHDDELVLLNLAAQEEQYRSAAQAEKCIAAHGDLLPSLIADLSAIPGYPSRRASDDGGIGGAVGVGQPANGSSNGARAAVDVEPAGHITGIKQRIEAFVYQRALDGEDLGVGHLFQASAVPGKAAALDELVRILHCNHSLVHTLVAMTKLPLHKHLATKSQSQAARVSEAVGRFHRFRSSLDEASISAVHALDDSHILMLLQVPSSTKIPLLVLYNWCTDSMLFVGTVMSVKVLVCLMWYSHELTHIHESCMWKAHMPHSLVMQQQFNTLAEQATGSSRFPSRASSPHISSHGHAGTNGSSSLMLSRSRIQRSGSTGSFSHLKTLQNNQNGASRCTDKQHNKNLREQVSSVLEDARRVGPERMGQFLLWHLPGASQGSWASPYTNPLLFVPIRKDRIVHFHGSRTLRFSASSTKIEFFSGGTHKNSVFDLDWSTMVADLDPSDASQPKFCDVKFHPYLPLVITCFPSLSCFCVHYRQM